MEFGFTTNRLTNLNTFHITLDNFHNKINEKFTTKKSTVCFLFFSTTALIEGNFQPSSLRGNFKRQIKLFTFVVFGWIAKLCQKIINFD